MEKPDLNSLRVNTQLTTGEALYIIQGILSFIPLFLNQKGLHKNSQRLLVQ